MKRVLCPQLPKPHRPVTLPETEANHLVRVLRLRDGDSVEAIDGQGHSVPAILRTNGGPTRLELATASASGSAPAVREDAPGTVIPLALEIAILKGDAMEWVVEKAVELGVRSLHPAMTAHTVVQVKTKGPEAFRERWQKIADQALKQCGRLERMQVELPRTLAEIITQHAASATVPRYWCDEAAGPAAPELGQHLRAATPTEVRLLIGPEGGWSEEAREWLGRSAGALRIQLGPLVLRAETAALYGMSLAASALRAGVHAGAH